jgi:sulfoxide reductase heme-binding subunit YedZ
MWHRVCALLLAVVAVSALPTLVFAQGPSSVPFSGQATLDQSRLEPQIALSGAATDGSGWQLQANLTANTRQASRRGGFGSTGLIPLSGQFTLSHAGVAPVNGTIAGRVDQSGSGDLVLVESDGTTDLNATVALDGSGGFRLSLNGALPPVPATAPAAVTAPVNHTFWYLSRATGLTAYLLLTLTVCFGLLVRTRAMDWLMARWRWFDLHQFTALLALAFVALHIFSLLGDHYIGFRLDQLVVPLSSPYRPVWVALGIVALYLMLVVVGSFFARRLIGYTAWRAIHYVTFAVFLLALLHGLFAGSDTGQLWDTALYWVTCMIAGGLVVWRLTARSGSAREPAAAPAELQLGPPLDGLPLPPAHG